MSTSQVIPIALRAKDAAALLGIAQSTFWKWVAAGKLPKGKRFSARCTVWRRDDLEQALERILEQSAESVGR